MVVGKVDTAEGTTDGIPLNGGTTDVRLVGS